MKSTKVINKILLISLAFGSVAFVAGILSGKKALVGAGATASVASAAGALASAKNQESNDNLEYQQLDEESETKQPPDVQQRELLANKSEATESEDANLNSLEAESNLLSNIVLNSSELQEEPEVKKSGSANKQAENEYKSHATQKERDFQAESEEKLEHVVSPIEENIPGVLDSASFTSDPFESNNFRDESLLHSEVDEIEEADINPFATLSDTLEHDDNNDENSDVEIANKLFGTFESAETDTDESNPFQDVDATFDEDSDEFLIEETEDEFHTEPENPIAINSTANVVSADEPSAGEEFESTISSDLTKAELPEEELNFVTMPGSESEDSTAEFVPENQTELRFALETESIESTVFPEPKSSAITEDKLEPELNFEAKSAVYTEAEASENQFGDDTANDSINEVDSKIEFPTTDKSITEPVVSIEVETLTSPQYQQRST